MNRVMDILWRVVKVLPVIGGFFILANASAVLRRKGNVFGTLEVVLDLLPVVCLIKAGVEIFTGDLIPARPEQTASHVLEATA